MITEIQSSDNKHFKRWKSLLENKGIKKHHQCLVGGKKLVTELLPQSSANDELLTYKDYDAPSDFTGKIYRLSKELFNEIDTFGTKSPLLVKETPQLPNWEESMQLGGLKLLCPLGDPANLGAIIRTAMAFDVSAIILCEEAANPLLPKAIRSSVGTIFKAPLFKGPKLQEILNTPLKNLYALDLGGENITDFDWPETAFLLVGEEGPGLPDHDLSKLSFTMNPQVESLNAVVASSLAIYSFTQSHPKS